MNNKSNLTCNVCTVLYWTVRYFLAKGVCGIHPEEKNMTTLGDGSFRKVC